VEFLSWAGEAINFIFAGTGSNNSTGSSYFNIGIDGITGAGTESGANPAGANFRIPFSSLYSSSALSEGYHYATPLYAALSAGSALFYAASIGGSGPAIIGKLRK
jgi:hypothetical protein